MLLNTKLLYSMNNIEMYNDLNTLHNSIYKYYLTGSRYFGGYKVWKSDWDFFSVYTVENENMLINLGFKVNVELDEYYMDPMTKIVYSKEYGNNKSDKIDIQLCHNIEDKLTVQNIIKEEFKDLYLCDDKIIRKKIWTLTYNVLKGKYNTNNEIKDTIKNDNLIVTMAKSTYNKLKNTFSLMNNKCKVEGFKDI